MKTVDAHIDVDVDTWVCHVSGAGYFYLHNNCSPPRLTSRETPSTSSLCTFTAVRMTGNRLKSIVEKTLRRGDERSGAHLEKRLEEFLGQVVQKQN